MQRVIALLLLVLTILAGCGTNRPRVAGPAPTDPAAPTAAAGSATAGGPASGPVTDPANLPSCPRLLAESTVAKVLGHRLAGQTTFLRAAPLPGIGRTGRVTCGYDVTAGPGGKPGSPVVAASVMTYTDAATAAHRVRLSVDAAAREGGTVRARAVAGHPADVAVDRTGSATLLLADGNRTVVVTLAPGAVPPARVDTTLTALAGTVLSNTARPDATPTAGATLPASPGPAPNS